MKANSKPFAISGEFSLRLLTTEDLDCTLSWRNDARSRLSFLNQSEITAESHNSWFEMNLKDTKDFVFVIIRDEKAVGQISLYHIDDDLAEAEIGRILTDPDLRGQGIMKTGVKLAHQVAQYRLLLKSLYLTVREDNFPALNLYKKIGYKVTEHSDGLVKMRIQLGN